MTEKREFYNSSLGALKLSEVILSIKDFIQKDPKGKASLVIGTDSHEKTEGGNGERCLLVVTAIVIYRHGFGGRYFWKRKNFHPPLTLREKIYAETVESLEFAKEFVPIMRSTLLKENLSYNVEIHVDVGEGGATRNMIKEVVGMVNGMGFVAKTKPDSFAASYVADRYT